MPGPPPLHRVIREVRDGVDGLAMDGGDGSRESEKKRRR
jgi:hypothetical protein